MVILNNFFITLLIKELPVSSSDASFWSQAQKREGPPQRERRKAPGNRTEELSSILLI